MSSPSTPVATPSLGAQAGALIEQMLLNDAAMGNADIQALVAAAVAKGIAANGDPNVAIPALMSVAITAPLMAPTLIPQFFLQGLKTFQALQALFNAWVASKLATPGA